MLKNLLKTAREKKGFKTRELAKLIGIDQALVSKYENGSRIPPQQQLARISQLLDIGPETLFVAWIKEKISLEYGNDQLVLKALSELLHENGYTVPVSNEPKIDSILEEMEKLKDKLQQLR